MKLGALLARGEAGQLWLRAATAIVAAPGMGTAARHAVMLHQQPELPTCRSQAGTLAALCIDPTPTQEASLEVIQCR